MLGRNSFKTLLAASSLALLAGGANAATTLVSCDTAKGDVTDYVQPTSSCFGLLDLSDGSGEKLADLNALNINGTTGGWSTLGKFNTTDGDDDFSNDYFSLDDSGGGNTDGIWSLLAAATAAYGEFMLIFKSGQDDNTLPAAFVGYILAGDNGTWSSPFLNIKNGDQRALSNVELYGRGTPAPVPVPAAGLMLLAGIGGLTAMRRRTRAA
jgi:hypothetical protein